MGEADAEEIIVIEDVPDNMEGIILFIVNFLISMLNVETDWIYILIRKDVEETAQIKITQPGTFLYSKLENIWLLLVQLLNKNPDFYLYLFIYITRRIHCLEKWKYSDKFKHSNLK